MLKKVVVGTKPRQRKQLLGLGQAARVEGVVALARLVEVEDLRVPLLPRARDGGVVLEQRLVRAPQLHEGLLRRRLEAHRREELRAQLLHRAPHERP